MYGNEKLSTHWMDYINEAYIYLHSHSPSWFSPDSAWHKKKRFRSPLWLLFINDVRRNISQTQIIEILNLKNNN